METQTKPTKVSADQVTTDTATPDAIALDYDESYFSVLNACYSNGTYIKGEASDADLYAIAEQWVASEQEYQPYTYDFSGVFDGLREYREDMREWRNRDIDQYPW